MCGEDTKNGWCRDSNVEPQRANVDSVVFHCASKKVNMRNVHDAYEIRGEEVFSSMTSTLSLLGSWSCTPDSEEVVSWAGGLLVAGISLSTW